MSALDCFLATWSAARDTFGRGMPLEGAEFDDGLRLRQLQAEIGDARPGSQWTGSAATSYDSANQRQRGVLGETAALDRRLRSEVERAAAVVTAGRRELDSVRQWVVSAASHLPSTPQGERALYTIISKGSGEVVDIVQKSNGDLDAIAGRLRGIGGEYRSLGTRAKEGQGPDGVGADAAANDQALRARRDVDGALKGDEAAQQRVRLVLDTVAAEQLRGSRPLTPEQSAYLSQMQAQQKLRNVDQLAEAATAGAADIMATSWHLMSNPRLEFPKTESIDGALQGSATVRGGFAALPDGIRATLAAPGIEHSAQVKTIADIALAGGRTVQTDTDFDRGLMHKTAAMLDAPKWRQGDVPQPTARGMIPVGHRHAQFDAAATSALQVVSGDHQVVHDAITGTTHADNDVRHQFDVDSQHLLHDLTHEEWDDRGAAAGALFEWTGRVAGGPEAALAASTAHAYGTYLGNASNDLMHLTDASVTGLDGVHTAGEVNPHLMHSAAIGLVPYVDEFAGNECVDGCTGTKGDGSLPVAKGLFTVLNGDENTAKAWNAEVYRRALLHETAFASNPSNSGTDVHIRASATLRGLIDSSTHRAFEVFDENQREMATTEWEWKKQAYDLSLNLLSTAGSELLGEYGPLAGPLVAVVGSALEDYVVGEPPGPASTSVVEPMSPQAAGEHLLQGVIAAGHADVLPDAVKVDGRVVGPPGAHAVIDGGRIVRPEGVAPAQYQEAVGKALATVLGPAEGGYGAVSGLIDQYNSVVANSGSQG
ncbi:hypothetical protein MMAD_37930 [Mycolicibacterium madagascariense]|uniref:ESX-1 secretion-associated protein EspA/EspE-like domain-containing protein n=1 Tax=Mycolicibacterium madagascariense TaxID=212765 RepID=A0A7I7XJX4_9MYCO|nr:EspA/EspE family type VII secretion system effector [Mycolicibacterium madagascariense]MCV7010823.1 DUF4226 domain-containing protein [Mycolicibacterium madagascariense]BBZ29498.1 hypothetical protein MMAD_37930 [Mycolicibacterium madagascariense]